MLNFLFGRHGMAMLKAAMLATSNIHTYLQIIQAIVFYRSYMRHPNGDFIPRTWIGRECDRLSFLHPKNGQDFRPEEKCASGFPNVSF